MYRCSVKGPVWFFNLAFLAAVKRRRGNVQVAVFDKFGHVAEEQRHDERVDVGAVHVGVGHDYNLVVAQLVDVGFLAVLVNTEAHA